MIISSSGKQPTSDIDAFFVCKKSIIAFLSVLVNLFGKWKYFGVYNSLKMPCASQIHREITVQRRHFCFLVGWFSVLVLFLALAFFKLITKTVLLWVVFHCTKTTIIFLRKYISGQKFPFFRWVPSSKICLSQVTIYLS